MTKVGTIRTEESKTKQQNTRKKNEVGHGSKNSCARQIGIFNSMNILEFFCCGTFESICIEHNLPFTNLVKSLYNKTPITYKNYRKYDLEQVSKKNWLQYEGWYAKHFDQ